MVYPLFPVLEISVEFKPVSRSTSRRVIDIVRAFGLGERDEYYTVFKDFRLEWDDPSVIFVTGESGGGKTTLLKAFKSLYGSKAVDMDDVAVTDDEVLCESIGRDTREALYFLSMAGLGEAMLFVRSYSELSAGQKYRYRLAKTFYKAVSENYEAIIVDEFCSLLDRLTARVVAYTAQKIARKYGKTFISASSHNDIIEDLNPDIIIVKPFLKPPKVEKRRFESKPFSLLKDVEIVEGRKKDYMKLEIFHYKGFTPVYVANVYKAVYHDDIVGVIVYSYASLSNRMRRRVFGSDLRDLAKSKKLLAISRVVVHPSWRGVGLGARLVADTLTRTDADIVEAMAAMAIYNPFFEKAGMKLGGIRRVEYDRDMKIFEDTLSSYGFKPENRVSWRLVYDWLRSLPEDKLIELQKRLSRVRVYRCFGRTLYYKRCLAKGILPLHTLASYIHSYPLPGMEYAYYYWVRPGVEIWLRGFR
ncbi:MAG: hypothetical protein QW374_04960 [Candidatus Bathyarchaeia archaeon]|nr:hypothetical protein [Candidatus Bathyarchaeota archaeon]